MSHITVGRRAALLSIAGMLAAGRNAVAAEPVAVFAAIEKKTGGRLGVFALATGSKATLAYRAGERFPMCSTFKLLVVGAVLRRVDRGLERLDRRVPYGKADLLSYAPVTKKNVARGGMTIRELCAATLEVSDNTAANLLLRVLGGPAAVTTMMRGRPFDDPTTQLNRTEPSLNTAIPDDPRDTTTPARMANAARLLTGNVALSHASTLLLSDWMHRCTTGLGALRAGVPADWYAGDKTGSGANGTSNDVAVFRLPNGSRVVVAAYLTGATAVDDDARAAALAAAGRVVAARF